MIFEQRDAIVRLLQDNDPETVRLVKEQLIQAGNDVIVDLRDLSHCTEKSVASHVREVLSIIEGREAEDAFGLLCHFFGDHSCLERANWMLAQALMPGLDLAPLELRVNSWGRQFLLQSSSAVSSRERVLLLSKFRAEELNFRG
ncbi:MAG: hypothetical protein ACOVMP_08160, partial [Chthoniobacterales bacterium]